ncbi:MULTISPECIES: YkyA family protein [unclassified Bacillus (in: firmicutes)]|uniref:YkyA family protein n=1 Tax=unclassified Bacillus (in: firmicutes) TaxID=185979 RepID=UPI0008E76D20|nr:MULTISPECIES: YkyA family protein [unclassified Bacillus (in: firmicutes)]SFJ85954.1 Putative cell-wall binding lipoprotein [Bacillus sp. 71mf]SFT05994.1 Putative cell-wall binding lipoprotein [Bacillus sp. 103mf]
MIYRKIALITALSVTLLSGCLGQKPEANLYVAFESATKQEKTMFEDTKKLAALEKQGQELYTQITIEGKENNQVVKEKLDQAVTNIHDRKKILEKEKTALDNAQKEVKSVDNYIKKLEDKKLQEQAEEVQDMYRNRADSFKKLYNSYKKSLQLEEELYKMLQAKDEKLKSINEKIKTINQSYEQIHLEKDRFNKYTNEYNQKKLAFYKQANIKIKEIKK